MKIPAKAEYALKALLELSLHWPSQEPLAISAIAARQRIPLKFLTQILLSLKSLGLVESSRGKQGGYMLRKEPSAINLTDVLGPYIFRGSKQKSFSVINEVLQEMDTLALAYLNKMTFDQLLKRERASAKMPMYTI